MVVLLLIVSVAVGCFTHYCAYVYGGRHMDRFLYYRYYRPLARRHVRVVDRILEATLDDNATAQQRNVKLVAQNAILRGKAIRHALNYRRVTRHLRRPTLLQKAVRMMTLMTEVQEQVDRLRRR